MEEAELLALQKLADAWNAFLRLPVEHDDDTTEFRHGLHALQRIVLARKARRDLRELAEGKPSSSSAAVGQKT